MGRVEDQADVVEGGGDEAAVGDEAFGVLVGEGCGEGEAGEEGADGGDEEGEFGEVGLGGVLVGDWWLCEECFGVGGRRGAYCGRRS